MSRIFGVLGVPGCGCLRPEVKETEVGDDEEKTWESRTVRPKKRQEMDPENVQDKVGRSYKGESLRKGTRDEKKSRNIFTLELIRRGPPG